MKFKVLLAVLLVSATATADMNCQNHPAPGGEYFVVQVKGEQYHITHYGHSRNSYEAIYKAQNCLPTRYGGFCHLTKTKDLSTWKNMPIQLEVSRYVDYSGESLSIVVSGFTDLAVPSVSFANSDCKITNGF